MNMPHFLKDVLTNIGVLSKPVINIVPAASVDGKQPVLAGQTDYATAFNGAAKADKVVTVKGQDLVAGRTYKFNDGLLVVDGDVPKGTKMFLTNAKLYVTGHVCDFAEITAQSPLHYKTKMERQPYLVGRFHIAYKNSPYKVPDGPAYPLDTDPTVTILGGLGAYSKVYASHGLRLDGNYENTSVMEAGKGKFQHFGIKPALFAQPAVDAALAKRHAPAA